MLQRPDSRTPQVSPALPWRALRFESRFVDSLPGDPLDAPADQRRSREVRRACHSFVLPTPVREPRLVALVPEVAELLDLAPTNEPELVAALAGNLVLPGMRPYAACYGGHQFGAWAGQLGDGRAITLAEVASSRGERFEVQLKGAGPTPYSRRADGRAVLRSSLRELVASEAMHHLGVPTTRALALVATGEPVMRDLLYDGHPALEPGAITCRVAPSFLRFGNYEIHAARGDFDALRALVDFTIRQLFPGIDAGAVDAIPRWFAEVCRRTARLIVEWMRVGFVHGVMNTDNMSILGLTIDYGPYGFLDAFDPAWTPNITDAGGRRYRFAHQPQVAQWNLVQLANALVPLVEDTAPLERGLEAYVDTFTDLQRRTLLAKVGLHARDESTDEDEALLDALFEALTTAEIDLTLFFRRLAGVDVRPGVSTDARIAVVREAFYAGEDVPAASVTTMGRWLDRWAERAGAEATSPDRHEVRARQMNRTNPLYVPRNYLLALAIERVEQGDEGALAELMDVLRRPYDEQPGREQYAARRPEWARKRPGCSMLSCSS